MKLSIFCILGLILFPSLIRPYAIYPPTNVLDKNYRQNFCSLLPSFQNNSITISQLLRGRTVNIGYNLDGANAYMTESTTGVPIDGFMTNLLAEMAKRGNFRINYVLTPNLTLYASTQIYAKAIGPYVDIISGQPFGDTSSRRMAGLGTVSGVADYTVILIGKVIITSQPFNLWAFLGPFQNTLWAFIAGLILFHGLVQFFVEYFAEGKENDEKNVVIPLTIPNSAFQALGDFAQADTYVSPSSEAGKLLRVGWAFFLIIVVSSYTANLTSFLITRPANALSVNSIDDANLRSLTLCMRKQSSFISDLIDNNYPAIFTYPIDSLEPADLMKTFTSDKSPCSGVILYKDDWQLINQAIANPDCLLMPVGNPIRYSSGSMPFVTDYTDKCTSLVGATLSSLLVSIKADGTYQKVFASAVNKINTGKICPNSTMLGTIPNSQLDFQNLAGIFVVYGALLVLSFLYMWLAIMVKWWRKGAKVEPPADVERMQENGDGDQPNMLPIVMTDNPNGTDQLHQHAPKPMV